MLDLTGILFSTVMMLLVIVRAVQLDRRQTWFEPVEHKPHDGNAVSRAWKRKR